jgi:glucan phosphorylase
VPIPGYDSLFTNNIRFWSAQPKRAFDLQSFNSGNYDQAVQDAEDAHNITQVLYPNVRAHGFLSVWGLICLACRTTSSPAKSV